MPKKVKNLPSEKELREFLENLPKFRLSKSEKNIFREYGDIKWPSKHWNDVKHIRLDARRKKTMLDSFEEGKKEQQESKNHETEESKGNRSSKRSKGKVVKGIHFHALLHRYLMGKRQTKEAKKGRDDAEGELLQVEAVVKEIETGFECKIVASEAKIQGFATNEKKQHYWKGKMDAVALGKNGRVLVIDWVTCDDVIQFWNVSEYCSQKVHQCLIYQKLVDAHLEEYFRQKMDSGIMIVAIDRENMNVLKPRLCVNFESLRKEGFFTSIDEFTWEGRIEKVIAIKLQELAEDLESKAKNADDRAREAAKETSNPGLTLLEQLDHVQQDLQQTQEHLDNSERSRQSAERQVEDKEVKIKELEAQGNGMKNQIKKLEQRVRELEVYLHNETRRAAENQENFSKQERRLMDVLQQQNKNLQHFKDQIDRGREEHQAAQYLAKVRYDKLQKDLKDAEDRAETAEGELNKARSRACVSGASAGGRMEGWMDNLYFKHDPWLHHHASQPSGPLMSSEIARSATLLHYELSAERGMEPCLCESPKKCAHSRGRGLCSCKANGLTCTNKCSCSRWECKNRF